MNTKLVINSKVFYILRTLNIAFLEEKRNDPIVLQSSNLQKYKRFNANLSK